MNCFLEKLTLKKQLLKDVVENLDLIPSNINLSGAEIELIGVDDKEYILKGITDKLRRNMIILSWIVRRL